MFCIDNHCEEKTAFGAILLLICVTLLFGFLILCALPAFTRENVYIYIYVYIGLHLAYVLSAILKKIFEMVCLWVKLPLPFSFLLALQFRSSSKTSVICYHVR